MNEESLAARLRREYGRKAARYVAVSAFNVVFGQALLVLAFSGFGLSFVWSNVVAVSISAAPAYVLTRYWVWQKSDKNRFAAEVLPFWAMAFLGLAISTVAVAVTGQWFDSQIVLNLTNLASFGCVWVVKFFVLDRILFVDRTPPGDPALGVGDQTETAPS